MVTGNSREVKVPEEVVREAVARYPGILKALVVARYLLCQGTQFTLAAGTAYGRLHMEDIPETVGRLAEELYHQQKRSFTIRVSAEDYPESRRPSVYRGWDHLSLEVLEMR